MTVGGLPAEAQARRQIDDQETYAGWYVCDRRGLDLVNHRGVAVRERCCQTRGRAGVRTNPWRVPMRAYRCWLVSSVEFARSALMVGQVNLSR